jgi:YHS domain-containing protein
MATPLQKLLSMNRTLLIATLFAALIAGCKKPAPGPARPQANAEMRTIDSANLQPAAIDPPPMLTDEAPPVKAIANVAQADAPPPPTPQDEALRASLPFSPAIAMDPVDGSKISIRASIPTLEYKNKLYYFANEEHKRTFVANPEQYTKGLFSHL